MYLFAYKGGSLKTDYVNEKFMLFFVTNGRELPLYTLLKQEIVEQAIYSSNTTLDTASTVERFKSVEVDNLYLSPYPIVKIFLYEAGFGIRRKYKSFYFRIAPIENKLSNFQITPFSLDATGFFFSAPGHFINERSIRKLYANDVDDNKSFKYYLNQQPLSVHTLKSIIKVTPYTTKRTGRRIRGL